MKGSVGLGRRIEAARTMAGYRSVESLMDAFAAHAERPFAKSTWHRYENGRSMPQFFAMAALVRICRPPGGFEFLAEALGFDIADDARAEASA